MKKHLFLLLLVLPALPVRAVPPVLTNVAPAVSVSPAGSVMYPPLFPVANNLLQSTNAYANPAWLNALAWGKITGTPTTLSGYGITDAAAYAGTPAQKGSAKEVWIAVRTDGKAGSGTKEDPFDGSTSAKFGALMAGFGTYTSVHLLPGTFLAPAAEIQVKTGWKVIGSGKGVTVVKLEAAYSFGSAFHNRVFNAGYGNETDFVEITDLTVDANGSLTPANPADSFDSIYLTGSYCRIANVESIHNKGIGSGLECFPLNISGPDHYGAGGAVCGNVIEGCLVHDYVDSTISNALTLFGGVSSDGSTPWNQYGGVIRGNSVVGTLGGGFQYQGYSGLIAGNDYSGTGGVWIDTPPLNGLSILGNTFDATLTSGAGGVVDLAPASGSFSNIRIANNLIRMTGNNLHALAIGGAGSGSAVDFVHNTVVSASGTGQELADINNPNFTNSLIDGNDSSLTVNRVSASSSFVTGTTFSGGVLTYGGNGSALTALNAANVSSGALADARLSSNVPLKSAANNYAAPQSILVGGGVNALTLQNTNSANIADIQYLDNTGAAKAYISYGNGSSGFFAGNLSIAVVSGAGISFGYNTTSEAARMSPGGKILIGTASDDGANLLQVNGAAKVAHLVGGSSAPTIAAGTGAGTSPSVSISGTDLDGQITVTTGTSPAASAAIVTVTFGASYGSAPHVVLSPNNAAAAALAGAWAGNETTTAFTLTGGSSAPAASTTYKWNYHAAQ